MTTFNDLQQRYKQQEHELHVHQVELEQQNEELRQINLELEQARNRYADLFEFAPVGYVVCDQGGLIQEINQTGCLHLGADCGALVGRPFALFVGNGQRAAFSELLHAALLPGGDTERSRMEVRMLDLGGRHWDALLECTGLAGSGSAGQPASLARLTLTDITQLKTAQRETERRTRQAQQLSEELQTFLQSMTHDLSAPMRQVGDFARLLGQTLQTPDERSARLLENLLRAASHMNALMGSLTRFFQSGQPLGRHQAVDLNRLVDQFVLDLGPERHSRQLQITHDPLPTLQADPLSLQMVFGNLLSNAVKFTRPCSEARIHVGVQEQEDGFLFSVRDDGVGFDPGQSGRLFGLFQRLHSDRDFEGQGLGLALARRIVERSGGRIWAESVLGQGSVFWIQLPRDLGAELGDPEVSW
ncbi:sensor histidine kinase [Deinococcus marmoris]|uniref:sensor histidine kinase n=1 Tax=Deinococcus marmoris TaxID=249408 RepID=UPI00069208F2|nr:ATP-binding protein [Deinococcus marmoris]